MPAPALLVAARAKYLASPQLADALSSGQVGTWQVPPTPWVFAGIDRRNGLPEQYGNKAAVVFTLRSAAWFGNDTSARFPKLGATVWVAGDPATPDAEWLANDVAESVIAAFDDPAGEHAPQWSAEVYVIRCRWDGELAISEVESMPGLLRADLAFNVETA